MRVLFVGPSGDSDGYGTAAAGIISVLRGMEQKNECVLDVLDSKNPAMFRGSCDTYDVAIMLLYPYDLAKRGINSSLKRVLERVDRKYLMVFWETDQLPAAWNRIWKSDLFDGFLAPSHFIAGLLQAQTNKPVLYCPQYIKTHEIDTYDLDTKCNEDVFRVLFVGQHTVRKGLDEAVIGFSRALGNRVDCQLIVKYHRISQYEPPTPNYVRRLVFMNSESTKAQVYVTDQMMEKQKLYDLYRRSSLLLFPSRGEGFGLPAAECMAAGLPVVYTDWSSLPEVCKSPFNYPVTYVMDEAHSMLQYGYEHQSQYAIPNVGSIMQQLTRAYLFWKEDRRSYYEKAVENRSIIESRFGYGPVSSCVSKILENSHE